MPAGTDRTSRGGSAHGARGATLIELIALMTVLAVLAGAAIPAMSGLGRTRSVAAARQLAGDLSDARRLAVAEGRTIWIVLEMDEGAWWFGSDAEGGSPPQVLLHPATALPMRFELALSPFHGASIVAHSLGMEARIGFDRLGRSRHADDSALDDIATITFSNECNIHIHPRSGLVDIELP